MLGVLLMFSACHDNVTEEMIPKKIVTKQKNIRKNLVKDNVKDKMSARLAQNLASSMTSLNVRNFLKKKTVEQFDGDYNFLIENSKEQQLSTTINGRSAALSFGQVLSGTSPSFSGRKSRESTSFLDSLSKLYPLMQVAIPQLEVGDAETWDTSKPPLVAFVPSDYDESDENAFILAYDAAGNQYELSGKEEPDQLVVVISENERFIAVKKIGDSKSGMDRSQARVPECLDGISPDYETVRYKYYDKERAYPRMNKCRYDDIYREDKPAPKPKPITPTCDRDRKDKQDYITDARFRDMGVLRQVEEWYRGKPEVVLYITRAYYDSKGNHTFRTSFPHAMGKTHWYKKRFLSGKVVTWNSIGVQTFKWNPSLNGDMVTYTWVEENSPIFGGEVTWNTSLNLTFLNTPVGSVGFSGTASFKIGGKDTHIATSEVYYCDNTDGQGTLYEAGMLLYLTQK